MSRSFEIGARVSPQCRDDFDDIEELAIVSLVKLDVYRSCTFSEKREVLRVFWWRGSTSSAKIAEGARQYGVVAIPFLVAVALELAVLIAISLHRDYTIGWFAGALEVITLLSIWRAILSLVTLRSTTSE
jgi:hypothetical protein